MERLAWRSCVKWLKDLFLFPWLHLTTLNPKTLINMILILLKLGAYLSAPLCPDMSWTQGKVGRAESM